MQKYKFLLFICLIFAISPCKLLAYLNLDFRHFTKNDGLAFNSVRSLYQDEKGIMWIGTYNGLNTYDGHRLKTFTREDLGVSSAFIGAIITDGRGDVLVGTDDGIVIYRYAKAAFEPIPGDELHDRVFAMVRDSEGNVWIGVRGRGLYKWDVKRQLLEKAPLALYGDSSFYRLAIDKNDRLYAAIYCENVISINLKDPDFSASPLKILPEENASFFEKDDIEGLVVNPLSDNILYIASKRSGLCRFNVAAKSVNQLFALPQEVRPTNLIGNDKSLWLSSTSGLLHIDLASQAISTYKNTSANPFSLSGDHITTTYINNTGCLWVGTEGRGLNLHEAYQENIPKFYQTTDGLSLNGVLVCGFAEDRFGKVWVATRREGLLCYDPQKATLEKVGKVPNNIIAIALDGDDLLMGYSDGIYRYNITTKRLHSKYAHFVESGIELDNRILDIKKTYDGEIYVGTSIGIMKYDRTQDEFVNVPEIYGFAVNDIEEDAQGYLWLATYSKGVVLYNPQERRVMGEWCSKTNGAPIAENVLNICVDENSSVWAVSFNSSFAKFNRDTFTFERIDKDVDINLPTESFLAAVSDSQGSLWLSANGELVIYNCETKTVRIIDTIDYLLDYSTNTAACHRLRNGHLLFGSYNGFFEIDPQNVTLQKIPNVLLVDFLVNDKVVVPNPKGPLTENVNTAPQVVFDSLSDVDFGFSLATPQVANHNRCDIYCRLNGFDRTARNVSTTMNVQWNNVPKGDYVFSVFTYGKDGQEIPLHKNVSVVVKSAFFHSLFGILFSVSVLIVILLVVFVLIYRHQEAAYNRKIALANEEIAQANEIIESLTQKEEIFIARLEEVIAENIADADFDVTRLEDAMCMSRSSLSRKIHALYKITPVTYLRNKRLEKAAEILSGGKYRVNEVCYQVGFSSPSYFIKCFKEYFQCSPSAYFRNNKN